MASEKILNEKKKVVAELKTRMDASVAGVLADYMGLTVEQDTKLRNELRKAGVTYTVVKNTLLNIAVEETKYSGIGQFLKGPTALATHENDMTAAAKILSEFAKKNEKFTIKGGFVDGSVIDAKGVDSVAKLPTKEELIAKTLYCLNAPVTQLAMVLNASAGNLARALAEVAKQKSE